MAENKPIVIRSKAAKPGSKHVWSKMGDHIKEFTAQIEAQKVAADGSAGAGMANISNAISGLPSPWARPNMFVYAMQTDAADAKNSGLLAFYGALVDEWKGMISSFALSTASSFQVKRVPLTYSNEADIVRAENIYEPVGAFGNMLFDKQQLWEDQTKISDANRIKKPFIDLVYFEGNLVGATSPESLCFTSPSYKLEAKYPFVNEQSNKFTDPISTDKLTQEQFDILYSYVKLIKSKLPSFYRNYENSKALLAEGISEKIALRLQEWMDTMEKYASSKSWALKELPPEVTCFEQEPFKSIFNAENVLYANFEGRIFSDVSQISGEVVTFNPDHLLLDSKSTMLAMIEGNEASLSRLPVQFLKAQSPLGILYFTIPLSELGLKVFSRSLSGLLNGVGTNNTSLSAMYNVQDNELVVQLEMKDNGKLLTQPITQKFKCHGEAIGMNQVIMWPNFISKYWNKYYLFSEMPHDGNDWQAFPIIGENQNDEFKIMDDSTLQNYGETPKEKGFIKLADKGVANYPKLAKLLVGEIRNPSPYKYEIYESTKPFKGLELRFRNQTSGYIFLNFDPANGLPSVENKLSANFAPPSPTRVGIDFGSNNSCVAYWDHSRSPGVAELLKFKNRRVSFFSSDDDHNEANKFQPASSFEMLFFQNDEKWSNKIKSTLTIHNESRIVKNSANDNINIVVGDVVKGGFLCFEDNVAIEESSHNRHRLIVPKAGETFMAYNMKWSTDPKENSFKSSYLRMLLLMTYAELLQNQKSYYPAQIVWAYPSAMPGSQINTYSTEIWDKIKDVNPLGEQFKASVAVGGKAIKMKQGSLGSNMGVNPGMTGGMGMGANPGMGGGMGMGANPGMGGGMGMGANPGMGGGMGMGANSGMGGGMGMGANPGMGGGMGMSGMGAPQGAQQSAMMPIDPVDLEIISGQRQPDYSNLIPEGISDTKACSEALSVAIYAANRQGAQVQQGQYILGFDVGGSTTDMMALTNVLYNGNASSAIVKQNSIRLAAGTLADATKIAPGFKDFLKSFAQQNNLGEIHALKNIKDSTVPFAFNQIVDRLNTEEELSNLYRGIGAHCKPLMWLNLYLTGMTMFYSGMIARKLRHVSENAPNSFVLPLNGVTIEFYGKGSRIFDWFKAVDPQNAYQYYLQCYMAGYGPEAEQHHMAGFSISNFNNNYVMPNNGDSADNVKVEVAKGLAFTNIDFNQFDPNSMNMQTVAGAKSVFEVNTKFGEILGEDGYLLKTPEMQQPIQLSALQDLSPALMQRVGSQLLTPQNRRYPRFESFMYVFNNYATQAFEFNMSEQELMQGISNINVMNELKNDESYVAAQQSKDGFDYVTPLFIVQGQSFLKSVLLPRIQRG
jgi:hypothetical protein